MIDGVCLDEASQLLDLSEIAAEILETAHGQIS